MKILSHCFFPNLFLLSFPSLRCTQQPAPVSKLRTSWNSTSSGRKWAEARKAVGLVEALSPPFPEAQRWNERSQNTGDIRTRSGSHGSNPRQQATRRVHGAGARPSIPSPLTEQMTSVADNATALRRETLSRPDGGETGSFLPADRDERDWRGEGLCLSPK